MKLLSLNLDKKILVSLIAGLVLLMLVPSLILIKSLYTTEYTNINIGNSSTRARVARTEKDLQKGLSNTKELKANESLLMVFDKLGYWEIWMQNMNYNIDVVWLNEDKRVVDLTANATPDSYPATYRPVAEAKYVLELPAGYIDKHGVNLQALTFFKE